MFSRSSGILLHISSLPGKYGIGSLGKKAFEFADFLNNAGQSLWQILPLCPTGSANCPYMGLSAFAGNHIFIDIDILISEGLLKKPDTKGFCFSNNMIDYSQVRINKIFLFKKAYSNFITNKFFTDEYNEFCCNNASWLNDYALFMALLAQNKGQPWYKWEKDLKFRNKITLKKVAKKFEYQIGFNKFLQFIFFINCINGEFFN